MKKNIRHCWSCKLLSTDDVCKVDNMKKSRNRKGCKQHKIDESLRGINPHKLIGVFVADCL